MDAASILTVLCSALHSLFACPFPLLFRGMFVSLLIDQHHYYHYHYYCLPCVSN